MLLILSVITLGSSVGSVENRSYTPRKTSLTVAMDTGSFNYFLYKGYPHGYQLELFENFARQENVNIEFRAVPDSLKLSKLSDGEVDIVVFSKGVDSLSSTVFSKYGNICSTITLDDTVKSVWLMRSGEPLALSVNSWAGKFKEQKNCRMLQEKYKKKHKISDKLSPYDGIMKKYSDRTGYDWRLIAAIVYTESKFRPEVVSKSGAMGLMQLMPVTAEYYGVSDAFNPEDNIRGGIKLIDFLTKLFANKGVEGDDLVNFVLASYNAGHGRIEYCMKYAKNAGLNHQKWSDVRSIIPLMKNHETAGRYRFNTGETLKFVGNVREIYSHYQHFFAS
jgi:membrane-bound lytic murein transglycosylase F